jgi:hypothetical protein
MAKIHSDYSTFRSTFIPSGSKYCRRKFYSFAFLRFCFSAKFLLQIKSLLDLKVTISRELDGLFCFYCVCTLAWNFYPYCIIQYLSFFIFTIIFIQKYHTFVTKTRRCFFSCTGCSHSRDKLKGKDDQAKRQKFWMKRLYK